MGTSKDQKSNFVPFFLFLVYSLPILIFANLISFWIISHFHDFKSFLNSNYVEIFPKNYEYISALRSFEVDTNTIAYIAIANCVSAFLCYSYGFAYVAVAVFVMPCRNIESIKSGKEIPFKVIAYGVTITAAIIWVLYESNFRETYVIYQLSVYRPLFSLFIVSLFLYCSTMGVAISVALISEKSVSYFVKTHGDV